MKITSSMFFNNTLVWARLQTAKAYANASWFTRFNGDHRSNKSIRNLMRHSAVDAVKMLRQDIEENKRRYAA